MSGIARSGTRIRGFDDREMEFQYLRGLGAIATGGGALGELLSAVSDIPDGGTAEWVERFAVLGDRLIAEAEDCLARGKTLSAGDLFLRASQYWRAAEYFAPVDAPRHKALGRRSRDAFLAALPHLGRPAEAFEVPLGAARMPAYFFAATPNDGAPPRTPRPTLIVNGGFDSSGEELYFQFGVEALRRGFHVVTFDGPGQTGMLRRATATLRPDWEAVLGPVVDATLARPEVDSDRLGLVGISFGGYFALRALTRDDRFAAACLNTPVVDLHAYVMAFIPPGMEEDFLSVRRAEIFDPSSAVSQETPPPMRANLLQLFHRFAPDAETCRDMMDKVAAFRVSDAEVGRVRCPVLAAVGEGEGELPRAQLEAFARAAGGPVDRHVFLAEWGADSHCQVANTARLGQITYDWFLDRFGP